MDNFINYVLWAKLLVVSLYVIYVIKGPSVWDRLLGMNLIVAKTIMVIITYAYISDMIFLLDVAIIYALFGFIGTIFIALFLSKHRLGKVRRGEKPQPQPEGAQPEGAQPEGGKS